MFIVQKMIIIRGLVLLTIVSLTAMSLTSLTKETMIWAQNYSNNETGSNSVNLQTQNLTMDTTKVTIVEGAAALVTSGTGPDDPNVANEFDSKALTPGEKFSHAFNNESLAGTDLAYFCQIHPTMVGTITIDQI